MAPFRLRFETYVFVAHYATTQKFVLSISDEIIGFLQLI
jgi:hypothetical protein